MGGWRVSSIKEKDTLPAQPWQVSGGYVDGVGVWVGQLQISREGTRAVSNFPKKGQMAAFEEMRGRWLPVTCVP